MNDIFEKMIKISSWRISFNLAIGSSNLTSIYNLLWYLIRVKFKLDFWGLLTLNIGILCNLASEEKEEKMLDEMRWLGLRRKEKIINFLIKKFIVLN